MPHNLPPIPTRIWDSWKQDAASASWLFLTRYNAIITERSHTRALYDYTSTPNLASCMSVTGSPTLCLPHTFIHTHSTGDTSSIFDRPRGLVSWKQPSVPAFVPLRWVSERESGARPCVYFIILLSIPYISAANADWQPSEPSHSGRHGNKWRFPKGPLNCSDVCFFVLKLEFQWLLDIS